MTNTTRNNSVSTSENPTVKAAQYNFITFGTALVLCVVTCITSIALTLSAPTFMKRFGINFAANDQSKVVYLDFEKVVAAGIKQSLDGQTISPDAFKADADKFQVALSMEIKKYAKSGYVVLNSRAVIDGAPAQDITGAIIHAVGADR